MGRQAKTPPRTLVRGPAAHCKNWETDLAEEMAGKKLINSPETAVDEALEGLVMLHPGLRLLQDHRVVVREKVERGKVALISGGGSGHEPFCAGYIGDGMLTGGVAGSVFASPPTASILAGIRAVAKDNPAGVLVLVINYTGDRIHFGLATERARREGIKVEMFVNGEDCALTSTNKSAGRRGLCGTMFIFKIAGARIPIKPEQEEVVVKGVKLGSQGEKIVKTTLEKVTSTLISMEGRLNELDSGCGDGDCGSTLATGAKAIQAAMSKLSHAHPLALMHELASLAENMGGSSGGIYSILLTSAGRAFQDQVGGEVKPDAWVRALKYGLEAVMKYGGAAPGDRTMIDALHPALTVLESNLLELVTCPGPVLVQAGEADTRGMKAKAGRASYVASDKVTAEDAGAVAAAA